ncbi:MAG: glycosyltransferase [Bacteroidia bacterium]|nr:glycosyltransferase [Bacteroidia bacterium]
MELSFSFIVPVFNRPQEIRELLESFSSLEFAGAYEIVIVEDGSTDTSKEVVESFDSLLNISYYYKENSGPGDSRNYGMARAKGNYFIILDSDVLLPPHYLDTVSNYLSNKYYHCFGGSDAAHSSFTPVQKAINYSMTSFLTTGGIRGNKRQLSKFEPRSFNMGISREAFEKTQGFAKIHPGEDPDLSHRIRKAGFETTYIPNAQVYHKRRISWSKFYRQVMKFGLVRPILSKWHPDSAKITFWFPSLFVLFVMSSILFSFIVNWLFILPVLLYLGIVFVDATVKNVSISIGLLSILAVFVQFFGYGLAFLKSTLYIRVLNKQPEKQFPQLFFK